MMNSENSDSLAINISVKSNPKDIRILEGHYLAFLVKRCLDIVVSCILSILLLPVLLLIAIVISIDSPGPIFHKQYRIGLRGNQFQMWKFRTMIENASDLQETLESQNQAQGGVLFKIRADPRCTKFGRFLRRSSLDELPQMINVIKGEMSLVGPRPLILRDAAKLPSEMLFRHDVLPGITGLWQIKGRSSLDVDQLYHWDNMYIKTWSLALDLSILLQTVMVLFNGSGSY